MHPLQGIGPHLQGDDTHHSAPQEGDGALEGGVIVLEEMFAR